MKRSLLSVVLFLQSFFLFSQTPPSFSAADIFWQLKKLKVLGSVLYIAAHPDDENTRLLAWLSKERMYRTGYLSITRGDGGQNLIGEEQGIELGLIRTQELLAARRIDGAEQFFTRGYDFGFTKTTAEALATWDKEKVLSDVVWVIRRFQPDIIIARFPEDSRAGHGHHSGSAVLAHEAFRAAADPQRFPEQFQHGVGPWQAQRLFWNTFNFGSSNTTAEDQLKIDVGGYNPLLGKGYGELAAESRSQHKSQGFGVPAGRGSSYEYFLNLEGSPARKDIMEGVTASWSRIPGSEKLQLMIDSAINTYQLSEPLASLPALLRIAQELRRLPDGYWSRLKLREVQRLIEACTGLWLEALSPSEYAVQGDTLRVTVNAINRLGASVRLRRIAFTGLDTLMDQPLEANRLYTIVRNYFVDTSFPVSQPYWMVEKPSAGSFNVNNQELIGQAQNTPAVEAQFEVEISGQRFVYTKPVYYKFTDPVKGELYEPLVIVPPAVVSTDPGLLIFRKDQQREASYTTRLTAYRSLPSSLANVSGRMGTSSKSVQDSSLRLNKGISHSYLLPVSSKDLKGKESESILPFVSLRQGSVEIPAYLSVTSIKYDHIPHIHYFYQDAVKALNIDLKTAGSKVGYIEGAGDKVPVALEQMGYEVTVLKEKDLVMPYLAQFDAILTGVRAYNINEFMADKYDALMQYVSGGGNLIVQYNTNNFISSVKSRMGPYPFLISRNRVTDEKAEVRFLLPSHPVLNFPNKIGPADFEGWIQERGIYFAEAIDPAYQLPLSLNDADEPEQRGSLLIADYGKGKFVYTGLVFFRELPAGVPGAFRLMANLIALNKNKVN